MKYKPGDWIIVQYGIAEDNCWLAYIHNIITDKFKPFYQIILVEHFAWSDLESYGATIIADNMDSYRYISLAFYPASPPDIKKCTCELFSLMNIGCKCGGK